MNGKLYEYAVSYTVFCIQPHQTLGRRDLVRSDFSFLVLEVRYCFVPV